MVDGINLENLSSITTSEGSNPSLSEVYKIKQAKHATLLCCCVSLTLFTLGAHPKVIRCNPSLPSSVLLALQAHPLGQGTKRIKKIVLCFAPFLLCFCIFCAPCPSGLHLLCL